MSSDFLKILQHVLTILDIETERYQVLLTQGIFSVRKLLNTKDKTE